MMFTILFLLFKGTAFIVVVLLSLFFPGLYIADKMPDLKDKLEKYVLSTVLGMVLFTLCAYLLAFLNLRFLMWGFPLFGLYSFLKFKQSIFNFKLNVFQKKWFILVLVMGVIGQVAINAPSGLTYSNGIYFWSSHGHDGVWHLALMQELQKNIFPFQNPEYANHKLQNYHFFVDLLMSEFSRLFLFSNLDVYFRFMPLVFSVLLGLSGFILVRAWKKSDLAGIWAMIFIYFAGSFGYIVTLVKSGRIGGESTFWVTQTQSILGNPPHAAAFVITTTFLFCLLKYLKNQNIKYFLICTLLGGIVIEFKVYAGALIIIGLLVLGIFDLIFKKRISSLLLFFTTTLLALGIYLPNSVNSQDFLMWQPWWYIRTMVVAPDRLGWLDLELRRQTYISEHNWKRVIQLETTAFLIFLIGNLGMRFIGFWTIVKQFKNKSIMDSFNLFFLTITFTSFVIPVFFLQKGVAWNSIQFNQYFLLFFGFLAAITLIDFLNIFKKSILKVLLIILILILTVPSQLGLLWQFYHNPPLSKISYEQLSALSFLKNHSSKDAIILTAPFDKYARDKYTSQPIPIYAWYDTGFIPAFSGRRTLISDEEQVHIMGYHINDLLKEREIVFQSTDYHLMNNFVKKYNVDYIYLGDGQKLATSSASLHLSTFFQNKEITIYKVEDEKK